tara:strand:+ start:1377 stop:2066 length:690 start_codon:yes stop_codon:yes gene_type:complete
MQSGTTGKLNIKITGIAEAKLENTLMLGKKLPEKIKYYKVYEDKPALFLDRDGVVIEDKHYISDPELVELCPGAKELIIETKKQGNAVILVTNQSGIARGLFDWKDYQLVTDKMLELLGGTATPTAIYANGYGPNQSYESWRKPNPGMLIKAAKDLGVDLKRSTIIGDRLSDLQTGVNAGLRQLIHVLTGKGHKERPLIQKAIESDSRFQAPGTIVRLIKNLEELCIGS